MKAILKELQAVELQNYGGGYHFHSITRKDSLHITVFKDEEIVLGETFFSFESPKVNRQKLSAFKQNLNAL